MKLKETVEDVIIGVDTNYTYDGGEIHNVPNVVPPELDFRICNIQFNPEIQKLVEAMKITTIQWEEMPYPPKSFKFIEIPRDEGSCQPDQPIIIFAGKNNGPEKPQS